jgi:hypothetical protein
VNGKAAADFLLGAIIALYHAIEWVQQSIGRLNGTDGIFRITRAPKTAV